MTPNIGLRRAAAAALRLPPGPLMPGVGRLPAALVGKLTNPERSQSREEYTCENLNDPLAK
jgi:hypothetical protein